MEANIFISILISWIFLAVVIGAVASTKGKEFGLWFFLSILLSPLLAGFCLVITLMPSKSSSDVLVTKDDFEEKWLTLINYDEGTKNAVKQLEVYGSDAIDELKKVLRATNDPSRLPFVVDKIAKDFQIKILEKEKRELAAQAAREIQDIIDAEYEIVALAEREIQDKILAGKKTIWMKRGRYALLGFACPIIVFMILLFALNIFVPSDDTPTIIDNDIVNSYNKSGLFFTSKGEYDLAMKNFKHISKGHYFAKINYVYAFLLKHQRSTLHILVLFTLIVAAILTYKYMIIRVKHYRYGLFVIMSLYICYTFFVVVNDITESKRIATIAAEKEQREKTEREMREKAEKEQKEKAEREKREKAEREQIEQTEREEKEKVEREKVAKRESSLFKEAETYLNKGKTSRAKVLLTKLAKNGKDPDWKMRAQQALESLISNSVKLNGASSQTPAHKNTTENASQIKNSSPNINSSSKEWSTPEALRAFGKPGDTVKGFTK